MTGSNPDTHGKRKPLTEAPSVQDDAFGRYLKCDPKTLALIAAQFMTADDNETEALRKADMLQDEALRKANALYNAACKYAKRFGSLPPNEQAIEVDPETALRELAEHEDLAIGDSEANSPALKYFREIATTKIEKHMTYSAFVKAIERHAGPFRSDYKFPETMAPSALVQLQRHTCKARSDARSARRKKIGKQKRTKRGL
jgi:hypothetical protein